MAQDAVSRLFQVDAAGLERLEGPGDALHVAQHLGRLAQQGFHCQVDRVATELRVGHHKLAFRSRRAEHGKGAPLTLAERAKPLEVLGVDAEDVTLLRLVAPDLPRRHAAVLGRDRAQVEMRAPAGTVRQLRHRVRQPARADVMDRQHRVVRPQLPAAVDDFLRASLDLGVAALDGIEVEVFGIGARAHARRGAAAHADQHAGAAELDQQRAGRQARLGRL